MKFLKLFALTLILTVATLPAVSVAKERGRACYSVDSRRGWQYLSLSGPFSRITEVEGNWTVDGVNQRRVGAQGYSGEVTIAADQTAPTLYDNSLPYGGLLIGVPGKAYSLAAGDALQFEQPLDQIALRINEGDAALTNNLGSLQVCFGN